MDASVKNCLFIYPRFTSDSFWNYRETCELVGAKYPEAPLGLITVAAMLPDGWNVRLNDLNVEKLNIEDVDWAELVFIGGQIFQQSEHLRLIDYFRTRGKTVIIGGPDATSSPHLYDDANHLILGEAEVTLPEFLRDYLSGSAKHRYEPGERKADMHTSPTPRFDLLDYSNYLNLSIQWNRGCPFMCEFCDIIELFGRKPRGGIDAVGKRDVDDPVVPAKGHRRLGPVPRQGKQPLSCSTPEQDSQSVFHIHTALHLDELLARAARCDW